MARPIRPFEQVCNGPAAGHPIKRWGIGKAYFGIIDPDDLIVQKIRKARTDPEPLPDSVEGLEGRAEAANLIGIYAALSGDARSDILNTFGGKLFSEFKGALSDLALDKLGPIGAEMQRLMKDPAYVDGVLRTGAERAKEISEKHMSEIHELIGVLRV